MRCSRCPGGPATVHVYEVRSRNQRDLCEGCADEEQVVPAEAGKGLLGGAMLQELQALQLPIEDLRARIEAELGDP